VVGVQPEDSGHPGRGYTAKLGDDQFDHEASTGDEVGGCVLEHRDLFLLECYVHDRIRDQVHKLEFEGSSIASELCERVDHRIDH
jgi:hypothetical protein